MSWLRGKVDEPQKNIHQPEGYVQWVTYVISYSEETYSSQSGCGGTEYVSHRVTFEFVRGSEEEKAFLAKDPEHIIRSTNDIYEKSFITREVAGTQWRPPEYRP
jgi:hypothetical protein